MNTRNPINKNNNNNIEVVKDSNINILNNPYNYYLYIQDKINYLCQENNIDISNINQFQFSFICQLIGYTIYRPNKPLLMCDNHINYYDTDKINLAIDVFRMILYNYSLTYYDNDLIYYLDISPEILNLWKRGVRVSRADLQITQKLAEIRKETHEKHMTSGKVNPMAELAYLNHHENYTARPEEHEEERKEITSLPKLQISMNNNISSNNNIINNAEFAYYDGNN